MTTPLYNLSFEEWPDLVIAILTGEVDRSNANAVERLLSTRTGDRRLVLDLSGLRYVDSAGIEMLLALNRGTALHVVLPEQAAISYALHVAGVDKLVRTFPDVRAATNEAS